MIKQMIYELTNLHGVSSCENNVADYIVKKFKEFSSDVSIDKLGNVICKKETSFDSNLNKKRIVLFAHMDEVGFIVRKIEKDGFLRIERIGGASTQILPGLHIIVHGMKGDIPGVIGTPSHHFIKPQNKFSVPQVEDLYIDIGAMSHKEVIEMGIDIGSFVTYKNDFTSLQNNIICGKSLDDRAGLAIILQVAQDLQYKDIPWEVYYVASVMEEFNIRGIMPVVRKIQPDVMLGLDITPACDTPDMSYNDIALQGGPAIVHMNFHGGGTLAGVLPNPKLLVRLENICENHQIMYQKEISPGVITEGAFSLFENDGIAVGAVSIPTRYTHSPIECISLDDVANITKLLDIFLSELSSNDDFNYERRKI